MVMMYLDRISGLPQPILQQILCSLSQEAAVKTCVLSKSWRHHWCTRPKVEIREESFNGKEETFLSVVDETLGRYHDQNLFIDELRFRVLCDSMPAAELLRTWIPKLRIFDIYLIAEGTSKFDVPSSVFGAESLQKLYLERCTLKCVPIVVQLVVCQHLKTLHLVQVDVEVESLKKMVSRCPLLESVTIDSCSGLGTVFKVDEKFHKIKHFEFSSYYFDDYFNARYYGTPRIEFDISSRAVIERISISCCPDIWFRNDYQITNLKSLTLTSVQLSSELLDLFSWNMVSLEFLELMGCYGFREFNISLGSIKHFVFGHNEHSLENKPTIKSIVFDIPSSAVIERIKISDCPAICFRKEYQINLKSLSLTSVRISSELLDLFSCNMVSLEFLELLGCYCLQEFNISLGSIKHFLFEHNAHSLRKKPTIKPSIVFDIPSSAVIERIKISDCPAICFRNENQINLKSLSLTSVQISSELLDSFSWRSMPILESLELVSCYGFKEFHLSSRSIKRFVFEHSAKNKSIFRVTSITIDAPNMLYFKYSTSYFPSLFSFTTTTESGHEWKSDLTLDIYDSLCCFLELHGLLKELSGSQISLKLNNPNPPLRKRKREITRDLLLRDDEKAVGVDHLELWLPGHSTASRSAFLNELFGICHPRNLVGDKKTEGILSKFFVKKREQDLEDLSIETKDGICGYYTPQLFRLKWREI